MPIARSLALSPAAERALADGRALLTELRDWLASLPATEHDGSTLANSIRQLDDFFLLVVVGEFNAGKSETSCPVSPLERVDHVPVGLHVHDRPAASLRFVEPLIEAANT
jgi:hypothetical protein